MNTTPDTAVRDTTPVAIREIEEFYIAQVNHLVEENLDSLFPALTDY